MTILTVQPCTIDTILNKAAPDNNYANDQIQVYSKLNLNQRSTLQFDISSYPSGATINNSVCSLYYYQNIGLDPVGRTYWLYKLTRTDWVEAQATWNIYKTGSSWTSVGGDYVTSSPSGGSAVMPAGFGWVDFDITAIVQGAYSGSSTVNLLLRDDTENDVVGKLASFYQSEYVTDLTKRPKLVTNLTVPGGGAKSWGALIG